MGGERNLSRLLAHLRPVLDPVEYAYALVENTGEPPAGLAPIMTFREAEGVTLIAERSAVDGAGLAPRFVCRRIILQVHSALDAVGLTAAVAAALAEHQISANMAAALFHDHVFVPTEDAERALAALQALSDANAL